MDADDVVLVALVKAPRDLEIARAEHWYRIPAKHAPAGLTEASYLAFYLTKAFGDCRWSIPEYAPVRGHELVRRRDLLPDESDHPRSEDAYYKLQLGPILALPHPIVSRGGRRILFIWTTGDKLRRAVELNDLLGRGEGDDALWQALKASRIRAERQVTVRDGRSRYRVDFWIPCARGGLAIRLGETPPRLPKNNKWQTLWFLEGDTRARPKTLVAEIKRAIRDLGGSRYPTDGGEAP